MSYLVSQRTREIGIRVALGAGRGTVISMVLRHGMTLVLLGVTSGMACFALARAIRGMLFGVSANDPLTFASFRCFWRLWLWRRVIFQRAAPPPWIL